MGRNKGFHSRKLVLSNLMGIRFAILKITRLGVAEEDEEARAVEEDVVEEAIP